MLRISDTRQLASVNADDALVPRTTSEVIDAAKILSGLTAGDVVNGGHIMPKGQDAVSVMKFADPKAVEKPLVSLSEIFSPATPALYRHDAQLFHTSKKRLYDAVFSDSSPSSPSPVPNSGSHLITIAAAPGSALSLSRQHVTIAPPSPALTNVRSDPSPYHALLGDPQSYTEKMSPRKTRYSTKEEAKQARSQQRMLRYYGAKLDMLLALGKPEKELLPIREHIELLKQDPQAKRHKQYLVLEEGMSAQEAQQAKKKAKKAVQQAYNVRRMGLVNTPERELYNAHKNQLRITAKTRQSQASSDGSSGSRSPISASSSLSPATSGTDSSNVPKRSRFGPP